MKTIEEKFEYYQKKYSSSNSIPKSVWEDLLKVNKDSIRFISSFSDSSKEEELYEELQDWNTEDCDNGIEKYGRDALYNLFFKSIMTPESYMSQCSAVSALYKRKQEIHELETEFTK